MTQTVIVVAGGTAMRIGKGTIYDKGGIYYCRWRQDGGQVDRAAGTERNAKRLLALVYARRLDGKTLVEAIASVFGETSKVTLATLADDYLLDLKDIRDAANLVRERSRAKTFKDDFHVPPGRVDAPAVKRWAKKLGKDRAGTTVNRYLAFGSKVWRYAQESGYAPEDRNPFRVVQRAPEQAGDRIRLTRDELDELLKRMDAAILDYAMAQVQTCWRPKELESRTWADLDLEAGEMRVCPRHDKRRTRGKVAPLSADLAARLKARRGLPGALVFAHPSGRPWTGHTRKRMFGLALDAAIEQKKIPAHKSTATWYCLKHTGITLMLDQGCRVEVLSQISGVSVSTIMRHYAGEMKVEKAAAVKKVWG